ncbi:MAG: AtpZ/AtpI family protein, partial [Chloroflexi bacterium]|nr:AtpZ/AtpI family protein [Chloroflexota bacterium]
MKRMGHLIGVATELGLTMGLIAAALVLMGLWFGRWLDSRLGISPVATILFLLAGAIAGQLAIYRLAKRSAQLLSADAEHALTVRQAAGTLGLAIRTLALIALPVLVGLLFGVWLDRVLQTRVLLTLVLALGGFVAGL